MDFPGRPRFRQMTPERAKVCMQQRGIKPTFKKVQVVYYLSRDGHLEHPHYMEVSHLVHQQLRLKDVMERLTVLRGKGVPSLYSWSCKRSYKNGYVWNDLAENDIIYPSEGAEYVLKGSELVEGCTEKLQHLQVGNVLQFQDTNLQPKHKYLSSKRHPEPEELVNNHYRGDEDEENAEVEDEEEEEYEEKTSYTSSTTPHSRCSRGVSTDEIYELQQEEPNKNIRTELKLENSVLTPPSNTSKVVEDGNLVGNKPLLTRNSMLLSLIACGGSGSFRKSVPAAIVKQPPPGTVARNGGGGLHKGVVCKAAAKVAVEDDEMISCMSENPRFGNLQSEEKEYFSGSIVESMSTEERLQVEPGLKKSSSHNEERSSMAGLGDAAEEESKKENSMKGKCIPMKKFSSKKPNI
ncbi:Hypothetical predicted protein [Olea europaea subsp. europaea]|uniref:SOSEKI DIX-like domain-containing protein n=1 Tax=Olea europaea subsp. europaea TaxID=158383 RepID=A0A8S0RU97_OLEEU|nr:Hypothetical predicted protein [Olea europaea subsp. europaea]